ncbi:hypothetical protein [Candidatus Jidaibacter acanthamoebae]|nr:hypothetical protein [Candidatus Jidaibacter acanthamoeba]
MTKLKLNANNIEVTFINNYIPALKAGSYTISLSQDTDGIGEGGSVQGSVKTTNQFLLKGERFNLNNLYTVFPQNMSSGQYGNCIPHVVLMNKYYPWVRSPVKGSNSPWLALLVFLSSEAPLIKNVELNNFSTDQLPAGSPSTILFYSFTLEADEQGSDTCEVIDIDINLFNQIAPTISDIDYLTHVREVNVTKKSSNYLNIKKVDSFEEGSLPTTNFFSVIIGNRILATPGSYTIHLVSLENMGEYLPNVDGSSNIDSQYQYIRLVSLHNWTCTIMEESRTLSDIIGALNNNYSEGINLCMPAVTGSDATTNQIVNNAYAMGYNVSSYNMRGGDTNLAWYRGPLVPYKVANNIISLMNSNPDSFLRYVPNAVVEGNNITTSMFDVSYSVAFQLGFLLAIQNKNFAENLYKWKQGNQQAVIQAVENEVLQEVLGSTTLATQPKQLREDMISNVANIIEKYTKSIKLRD